MLRTISLPSIHTEEISTDHCLLSYHLPYLVYLNCYRNIISINYISIHYAQKRFASKCRHFSSFLVGVLSTILLTDPHQSLLLLLVLSLSSLLSSSHEHPPPLVPSPIILLNESYRNHCEAIIVPVKAARGTKP